LERGAQYAGEAPNRAPKARALAGASPKNFEKLDAISCNLACIFGIRMASDIIKNAALQNKKQ